MFTGIIEELGIVESITRQGAGLAIRVLAPKCAQKIQPGGSININGVCQSAVEVQRNRFTVVASPETVRRTNFRWLREGDRINLETPLSLSDPIGGHLVCGHVDGTGQIVSIGPAGSSDMAAEGAVMQVSFDHDNKRYLVEKGSVAIDGISLTCYDIRENTFCVSLIPETIQRTNLLYRRANEMVNLEFDILAKYVEKMLTEKRGGVTREFLEEHGFKG